MSGIAGLLYLDGQLVSNESLEKMRDTLYRRGPDGASFVNLGNVGFVHLMSQNLPESMHETLPFICSEKRYLITFYGRIDNRKELENVLSRNRLPLADLPDSQLALLAYKIFGQECAEKILGDFAFAIWDTVERVLFCCRDHLGVKPFYYIENGSFFAFASEIKAILTLPNLSKKLNSDRLADFLVCLGTEKKQTVYQDIFKLQPAHFLLLKNNTLTERKYWQLAPYELKIKKESDYSEAFYEIFKDAVKARLRTCKPIASYLSGGIDSSSIVCMAAGPLQSEYDGILNTFSVIYPRLTLCDERKYFHSIIDRYSVIPNYVEGDNVSPGYIFDTICNNEDEPHYSPNAFHGWNLMGLAKEKGMRVILDGHDGDSSLSHGEGLLAELATQGRIFRLASEMMGFPHATRPMVFKSIITIYIDLLRKNLLPASYVSSVKKTKLQQLGILAPELLRVTNVKERVLKLIEDLPDNLQTERKKHYLNVTQPFHVYALEFLERTTSFFQLCGRYPLFDIRLIAYCLSLPAEMKLRNGYNRYIVRKSLAAILPESIIRRKGKTNFAPNLVEAFTVRDKDWLIASFNEAPAGIYEFINKKVISEAMERCINNNTDMSKLPDVLKMIPDVAGLLHFLSLSKWMRKTGVGC